MPTFDPHREPLTMLQWIAMPFDLATAVAMIWAIVIMFGAIAEGLQVSLLRAVMIVAITTVPILLLASLL